MDTIEKDGKIPVKQARLQQFLQDPSSYPHQPGHVECIQTHASYVMLVDPYVYKVKKPVDFEFLDYSTLEKRKYYCDQEVELNKRLCADMYLGVVPIRLTDGKLTFDGDNGVIVDYAVKMKLLSKEHFLSEKVGNHVLSEADLKRTADKLAPFYRKQKPDDAIKQWGEIEKLKISTDENFTQTEEYIGQTLSQTTFDLVKSFTNQYYQHHQSLFQQRIKENRIKDGHGDLHLDHIHVTPEKVCIYDCIEFNDRFRYVDVANDVGFLAMDLDFHDQIRLSHLFIRKIAYEIDDPDLERLIDFYKCYRAYVRGKVESFRSTEKEVPPDDQQQAAKRAASYFDLSLKYAVLGSEPVAIILMGRIGTGKSTLARNISKQFNLEVYNSDRIRKELAGLPVHKMSPEEIHNDLYSKEMSEKTYAALYDRASVQLQVGRSVILDATFSRQAKRKSLVEMFKKIGVPYYFVETVTSDRIIKKRLVARENDSKVVSDARLENFETLNQIYESPEELNSGHLLTVNTEQPVEQSVRQIYKQLLDSHLKRL